MMLGPQSTLLDVVMTVGTALHNAGLRAVLTGGACANFYTAGAYSSMDADFVLTGVVTQRALDEAMGEIGFVRVRDHFEHASAKFIVEFPKGPLAIGSDHALKPCRESGKSGQVRLLSPTDSCRDRLAQFYFWKDRQGLKAAIAVALHRKVGITRIRQWSIEENCLPQFLESQAALRTARAAARQASPRLK